MNIHNDIEKFIQSKINTNSNFEFIAGLEDLTLSDIDYIENIINIESKLIYNIIDNTYIKIQYLVCDDEKIL